MEDHARGTGHETNTQEQHPALPESAPPPAPPVSTATAVGEPSNAGNFEKADLVHSEICN